MPRLKHILSLISRLAAIGAGVLVVGSLISFDWQGKHSARTAALPHLSDPSADQVDGLVLIEAGGMTFRARVAGMKNDGPGLVLLHGFPETSAMWGPLLLDAAAAGYRVVAFDQRGYSPGARPEGVEHYVVPELVGDVLAIADAVGFERFHLVGHDWGCIVGWGVTALHPERLLSYTGLSIPHPGAFIVKPERDIPTYVRFFMLPLIPEFMFSNGLWAMRTLGAKIWPREVLEDYISVFSELGAMTGGFNWYRAISLQPLSEAESGTLALPLLFVYGNRDFGFVTEEILVRQRKLATGPYTELELDGDHWLMEGQTEGTVKAILAHLENVDRSSATHPQATDQQPLPVSAGSEVPEPSMP